MGWKKVFDGIFIKQRDNIPKQDESQNITTSGNQITGILTAYVDDILLLSENPVKDLNVIAKRIKCSDLLPVNENRQRHVGYEIFGDAEHIYFDMQGYIEDMPTFEEEVNKLGLHYAKTALVPNNLPFEPDIDPYKLESYPAEHIHLFQRIVGQ